MIRQIVQCRPGLVEQLLLLLRQKIEEKQKQSKAASGPGQEPGTRAALEQISYLETGCSSKAKGHVGGGCAQASPGADRLNKSHHGYAQTCPGDTAVRLQLAEREQALLLAQETIQILQMKVRRLEQLVHLKNIRIDDLSQRLQQAECQPK
ncbi:SPEF1 protein, partial [Dromaius novaehollandiae]|nr:SPEF1 protein [Dromaius novaehollandiae]